MPPRVGNKARRRRTFIKEWRVFRKLSQEQLADRMNTTKANISRVENAVQPYTQDLLEAVADALGTHAGTLLTRGPTEADIIPAAATRKRA